jgi:UrcA family protein
MCRPVACATSLLSVSCVALSVLLSPPGVAVETAGYEPISEVVKFADLDLTRSTDVAILYSRIKLAANQVCEPQDGRSMDTMLHIRHCEERAVAKAVTDVNSGELTALHQASTNQVQAALLR